MDPKHLKEARSLSRDALKQATERFRESKQPHCNCGAVPHGLRLGIPHKESCPAYKAKEAA